MTALDTSLRVLRWAVNPAGSMPSGDALGAQRLLAPPRPPQRPRFLERLVGAPLAADAELTLDDAKTALGELIAAMRARLYLGGASTGSATTMPIVLALALGLRDDPVLAANLTRSIAPPITLDEMIARHALIAPVIASLDPDLAAAARSCSPLTRLLTYPAVPDVPDTLALAEHLLSVRGHRSWLITALAAPTSDASIRGWRAQLLTVWRSRGGDGVDRALDVYETAFALHGRSHAAAIARATSVVLYGGGPAEAHDDVLADALSVADWWRPLAAIRSSEPQRLRARIALDINDYLAAIRLADVARPVR